MKKRGKIIVIFLIGLLLIGIGSGVAFAEFLSFGYGGVKDFSGDMTTITLQETLPEDVTTVYLMMRGYDYSKIKIEPDNSMTNHRITVEVTCNEKFITPYMYAETEMPEDTEDDGSAKAVYSVDYGYYGSGETAVFFQMKDEVLKDIRNRTVYTYSTDYVQNVTIKAAPDLAGRLFIR